MKSLFNASDNQEIVNRINKLSPESKGLWGKMNVEQMLAHSRMPLMAAYGKEKMSKRGLISFLFGKMAKKQLIDEDKPFKKNLPTDKKFIIANPEKFEKEKQALIEHVREFSLKGPDAITKEPHGFFGNLTPQEWDKLQYRHLDHHLSQFAV
ncbi:MAG: DUF1569 domain-containing protein [Bacteroidia bacterium]